MFIFKLAVYFVVGIKMMHQTKLKLIFETQTFVRSWSVTQENIVTDTGMGDLRFNLNSVFLGVESIVFSSAIVA